MISQKKGLLGLAVFILTGMTLLDHSRAISRTPEWLPGPGTIIPAFSLAVPVNDTHKAYLHLEGRDEFQPGNITAEVVLIEIFSVYCAACLFQRPFMNELYAKIAKDPELKNRVKMIGIGAGNNKWDISYYQDEYKFPLFPDPDFTVHNLVGAPAAPFLIFARPDGHGRLFAVDTHLGKLMDSDKLLTMVRKAYRADILKLALVPEQERLRGIAEDLIIPISQDQLMEKVRQSLSGHGKEPRSIQKILLPELGTLYVGTLDSGRQRVFARVVARRVPCVDCHNVFFVYSFDHEGRFLEFVPIYITKEYNRKWDSADIRKIQSPFVGKSILQPVAFNAKVDAVTSATISSQVVFNSINKTHLVYEKLVELGHITTENK